MRLPRVLSDCDYTYTDTTHSAIVVSTRVSISLQHAVDPISGAQMSLWLSRQVFTVVWNARLVLVIILP